MVSLARRPVLFALARALGEAWPGDVSRDTLVARAFGSKRADESHRARLRVEVGRLRAVLRTLADVSATKRGFALAPRRAREVVVLAWPVTFKEEHAEEHGAVLAFLADGESWSSSAPPRSDDREPDRRRDVPPRGPVRIEPRAEELYWRLLGTAAWCLCLGALSLRKRTELWVQALGAAAILQIVVSLTG